MQAAVAFVNIRRAPARTRKESEREFRAVRCLLHPLAVTFATFSPNFPPGSCRPVAGNDFTTTKLQIG